MIYRFETEYPINENGARTTRGEELHRGFIALIFSGMLFGGNTGITFRAIGDTEDQMSMWLPAGSTGYEPSQPLVRTYAVT